MPNAVTTTTGTAVARPVANMDATGEGTYATLNQLTVSVAYDDLYDVSLNEADSYKLANSFTLSGNASTFTASLSNPVNFKEVLVRKLAEATCTTQGSAFTPSSVGKDLADAINGEIGQAFSLLTNSIPDILEEATFSNSVDWSGGLDDLIAKMDVSECEILAQQLPESNYGEYSDGSGASFAGLLPLLNENTVVFVFNVSQSTVTRVDSKTPGQKPDDAAGVELPDQSDPVGPYGTASQRISYQSNSRLIAFRVKVEGTGVGGKIQNAS